MTAPTRDERETVAETLDERLDRLFGPSDPATDAWIEASLRQRRDARVIVLGGAR